jgi:phospholipid transport system substrate-binding protein
MMEIGQTFGRIGAPGISRALGRRAATAQLLGAAAVLVTAPRASAQAKATSDPGQFLETLGHRAIQTLSDPAVPMATREDEFRVLFDEGFDVPTIAHFVLGRYGRQASAAQRAAFAKVFQEVIVQRFLPLFSGTTREFFVIARIQQDRKRPHIHTVTTKVIVDRSKGTTSDVLWRLGQREETFKILDVVVEGVSMAISLRSEYGSVLKQHRGDLDQLIAMLRRRLPSEG